MGDDYAQEISVQEREITFYTTQKQRKDTQEQLQGFVPDEEQFVGGKELKASFICFFVRDKGG